VPRAIAARLPLCNPTPILRYYGTTVLQYYSTTVSSPELKIRRMLYSCLGTMRDYAEVPCSAAAGGIENPDASVRTFSSKNASPDELVALANDIWKKITSSGVSPGDEAGSDKLLETLQKEFGDFNASFPLVLRWMVQLRRYQPKAFRKFLLKYAAAKLNSREDFLRLQAEYPVFLYRAENKHPPESAVNKYRELVVKQLLDEDREFLEVQKQVEKELEERQKQFDSERRRELYALLLGAASKGGGGSASGK